MAKTTITESRFCAVSKLAGNYPSNSPVFFMLELPASSYREHRDLFDGMLQEIEANSLYSSLEVLVEKLNKLISKKVVKQFLSIALFQKDGSVIKAASFPSASLSYTTRTGASKAVKLSWADTNRVFSEILEIDSALSSRLEFSFEAGTVPGAGVSFVVEKEKIALSLPRRGFPMPKRIRSYLSQRKAVSQSKAKHSPLKSSLKYGVALLVAVLVIVVINSANSNKFIEKQKASNEPWAKVAVAEVKPVVNIAEKLPSKYVHEPAGLIRVGNFIYTYQNEPNIILQIDFSGGVKPIVIDSEKIGRLTGMKKVSDDLFILTHDKRGLIFLAPNEGKWRHVDFVTPAVKEYTDIEVYNDYIYILDARSREIWKLQLTENELEGNSWVRDSRVDLSLASGMAIDGSIYLTLITGDVVKLTQGKKDSEFKISAELSPSLTNADSIDFDESSGRLTLLDRVNNRIVFLGSKGEFLNQLKNPFPLPFDAVISESGSLYGIIQSDVVEIISPAMTDSAPAGL